MIELVLKVRLYFFKKKFYLQLYSLGNGSIYSPGPEYDDPANCAPEDEQYGSQYGGYGAPYDQYGSRGSIGRRSLGTLFLHFGFNLSVLNRTTYRFP